MSLTSEILHYVTQAPEKVAGCSWRSGMRKVIVVSHVSLDGVIQAPGGPEEDPSGGFAHGGWAAPYSDDVVGAVIRSQMNLPFDLLLGRITYDIWAPYWPQHADIWPTRHCCDQVRRLAYKDFRRLAARRVSRRGHRRKSHRTQATARAGSARLWEWKSPSDASEA